MGMAVGPENSANPGNISAGQRGARIGLIVLAVLACGWLAADMTLTLLFGPVLQAPEAAAPVVERAPQRRTPIDKSVLGRVDPFFRDFVEEYEPEEEVQEVAPETSLSIQLFGVRAASTDSNSGGRGSAIIEDPKGVQSSFTVGDEIIPGVKLLAVYGDYVEIMRGGVRESLFFPGGRRELTGITAVSVPVPQAPAKQVPKPKVAERNKSKPRGLSSAQVDRLMKSTSLNPVSRDGMTYGVEIQPRGGDLLLRRLGLLPGDVLVEVNGTALDSNARAAQLEALLKKQTQLDLVIERGGARQDLSFRYSEVTNDDD